MGTEPLTFRWSVDYAHHAEKSLWIALCVSICAHVPLAFWWIIQKEEIDSKLPINLFIESATEPKLEVASEPIESVLIKSTERVPQALVTRPEVVTPGPGSLEGDVPPESSEKNTLKWRQQIHEVARDLVGRRVSSQPAPKPISAPPQHFARVGGLRVYYPDPTDPYLYIMLYVAC